ncbi:hypothetical protein PX52LOC_07635 [Limnoglobus roseus]|uniref:Uncharacterized protein n=1 Tax=Limnoglobus roseus TaxID=2598579 RepID=A0A5C1ANG0_9BACT|nr:hypothetical protein PX52LOC_07635 [Limnoglobus roseus]
MSSLRDRRYPPRASRSPHRHREISTHSTSTDPAITTHTSRSPPCHSGAEATSAAGGQFGLTHRLNRQPGQPFRLPLSSGYGPEFVPLRGFGPLEGPGQLLGLGLGPDVVAD